MSVFQDDWVETGVEEDAAFDVNDPNPARVSPTPAPAGVETGFGDVGGTPAPVHQATSTVKVAADAGDPEKPDVDLGARVAALLPNKLTTDWKAVSAFMAAVVPWPGTPADPGYVNLHYSMVNPKPTPGKALLKGMGWPFRALDKFVERAAWIEQTTKFKDVWFCTSLQSKMKTNTHGKPKAVRFAINALSLKAIWIDLDVDPADPEKYPTVQEALKAVLVFHEQVGLPAPSAIVCSGSGLHVYWISDQALPPATWALFAEGLRAKIAETGLKCDAGLTTDGARILRVPGTFNHKTTPPKPVLLLDVPLVTYNFETQLSSLKSAAPPKNHSSTPHSVFAAGATKFTKPAAAFAGLTPDASLQAGIDQHEEKLLKGAPIFLQCDFLGHALKTEGADYDNPLWNLSILCSTFMENGNAVAHAISKGHRTYTHDETQQHYERKMAERHDRGLGYPSCATIAANGCKSCATCPLFAKGKSPLNIRPAVTATVTNSSSPASSSSQAKWTGRSGVSFANIPHRKWLYGNDLVRGELTVLGSPGGAGKSSLAIGMAISIAVGRELLGEKIRGGRKLRALVINGEDSTDEIRRRTYAFCLAHKVAEPDLQRITVVGAEDGRVQRISFLTVTEKGVSALNQNGFDTLQLGLDELRPDVVVIDPLVSFCAGGNVNDNAVMSAVMRKLKEIAAHNGCAVLIVHHTRKGGDAGNVEAISGAAAITNLARRAIMPAPLSDAEAIGILPSERPQYFKLVDAKSNLVPRAANSPVYRMHGIELPNPEPPLYPHGDNVQAITRVVLPIQSSGAATAEDMKMEAAILDLVDRGKEIDGQAYPYSPSPAGANNERALLPDAMAAVASATAPRQWLPSDLKAVTDAAIKKMKSDGRLVVVAMKDLMPKASRFRGRARGLKAVPI